jgi:hypothetical protein
MATLNKPMRLLLIVCAGISTFYVSARLAGSHSREDSVAEPVARAQAPRGAAISAAPATALPNPAAAPTPSTSPAQASAATPAPSTEADTLLSAAERARSIPRSKGELFTHLSWLPPPPAPAPPPPSPPPPKPPEPKAPPLPFTFVGILERGSVRPEVFLAKADTLLVVAEGDLLDNNTYRVDSLNANEVVMTYLPLNIQQTLQASGATR